MLIAVISGPSHSKAKRDILKAPKTIDAFELRLDLIEEPNIADLMACTEKPIILKGPHPLDYASFNPAFVDVDLADLKRGVRPSCPVICSHHDLEKTPEDLEGLFNEMKTVSADIYKLATRACSSLDALRLMAFRKRHKNLSAHCMGEFGIVTRRVGPLPLQYVLLEEGPLSDLGLLTPDQCELKERLFCLIGNPVQQSPSHITHNRFFEEQGINAFYAKFKLEESELPLFFQLAEELDIGGISVTIPFKERVAPFLKEVASESGAINTICLGRGSNTDGIAALDVIEKKISVRGRKIAVLGAGGTARAIIHEAKKRGADVVVINRTKKRGEELAKEMGSYFLESIPPDLPLINATSADFPHLDFVLDVRLKTASGQAMFIRQAELQMHQFFGSYSTLIE